MPERRGLLVSGLMLAALALAAAGWFDAFGMAVLPVWLAQVPAALAIALLRGYRGRELLGKDAVALGLLWAGGFALAALLLVWPALRLQAAPGLGWAMTASAMVGALLLLLWRQWPLWFALEREGGRLRARYAGQHAHERDAWSGLRVAVPVLLLLAGGLLLAWPGLLAGPARVVAVAAYALLLPFAHWLLQSAPARLLALGLPVVEMRTAQPLPAPAFRPKPAAKARPKPEPAPAPVPVPPMATPGVVASEPVAPPAATKPTPEEAARIADLYAAARTGRVDRALELLDAGVNASAVPPSGERDRRSLPVLAAVLPDLRLLRALIARGIDLNAAHAGMTPLLAATRDSWHGRPEAVMTLLANGADPRLADAEGNTPLHHAARSSDPGVAALLLDAAADKEALNVEGLSPLGSACAIGNWRLAKFLLERGAKAEPPGGAPALLAAAGAEDDDPAGVQFLLRARARIDARNQRGRSALHEAALAGHPAICDTLLDAGADVHARDGAGRTPLLDGARAGSQTVLETLLAAHADPLDADGHGANALHHACAAETPSLSLVRRLLELRVDPNALNVEGISAVDVAARGKRWALVAAMDPRRSQELPAFTFDEHAEPIAEEPPLSQLRERLLEGAPGEALAAIAVKLQRADFDSLLADDDVAADEAHIAWLLKHGANPEARAPGRESRTVAALARGGDGIAALRLLFSHGASPAGAGGLARYLAACADAAPGTMDLRGAQDFALELLERGADPFAPSPGGETPVTLAVRLRWPRLLAVLIAHGVDLDARDGRGRSALHLAAALGDEEAIRQLIAAGAAPDRRAADGQTPLGVALAAGRRDLADWLDWRDWKPPRRPLRPGDLPTAAVAGDVDAVRRLLELGLPVNATDAQGCSALLRAAGGGHVALVDLLLERGALPGLAAHSGATALSAAVSMRHGAIVDRLLAAGAGLEQRLPGEITVLMLAAAHGLPDVVAKLLQAGADIGAADAQGLTPLHCACLYGFTARERPRLLALFDTLLLAGADAQLVAIGGVTPLLLLLGARAQPGTPASEDVLLPALERLLDEEARLDVQDARGFGPLHLAGLHGLPRVAQALLRAGANPALRDAQGRHASELAQLRGFVDVAAELAPPAAPAAGAPSMARFLRE